MQPQKQEFRLKTEGTTWQNTHKQGSSREGWKTRSEIPTEPIMKQEGKEEADWLRGRGTKAEQIQTG